MLVAVEDVFLGVIRLNGLGDDGAGRVAFLIILTLGRYRPSHITRGKCQGTERYRCKTG